MGGHTIAAGPLTQVPQPEVNQLIGPQVQEINPSIKPPVQEVNKAIGPPAATSASSSLVAATLLQNICLVPCSQTPAPEVTPVPGVILISAPWRPKAEAKNMKIFRKIVTATVPRSGYVSFYVNTRSHLRKSDSGSLRSQQQYMGHVRSGSYDNIRHARPRHHPGDLHAGPQPHRVRDHQLPADTGAGILRVQTPSAAIFVVTAAIRRPDSGDVSRL